LTISKIIFRSRSMSTIFLPFATHAWHILDWSR
jgi:hypothetical protein